MDLNIELTQQLLNSSEKFPVDFEEGSFPDNLQQVIKVFGVQKVKDALRKTAEKLEDIKRNPAYLDLDDKYRSSQAELIIQKAENEALRAQVLALQALAAKSSD